MEEGNLKQNTPQIRNPQDSSDAPSIIQTDVGMKNGQDKCPRCGSTDIALNVRNGKLRCNFCRYEFVPEKLSEMETDITKLKGQVIGSGAQNIAEDTSSVLTLKCSSCGAEVVIDTSEASQARCHWCRNTLSINQQVPNGSIPDVLLPFQVTKDDAKAQIEAFVGKRKFFVNPKFKQEFTTQNIMGVYFPYMVVDMNAHAKFGGKGEKLIRSYTVKNGEHSETCYDADVYHVEREFDIAIHGLTIESNSDRLDHDSSDKTNNVINSIMPFDIENCVKYNANYLRGYTSEKRDTDIEQLKTLVDVQGKDIAKIAAKDTLREYDRGVAWSSEQMDMIGQQWKAAYLPVWLYSYQQVNGDKKIIHYVAVNARTKETMGSVPIHMPKLIGVSTLVEILGIFAMIFIDFDYSWLFLSLGVIYFLIMYARYRNKGARHRYESETKSEMFHLAKVDTYEKRLTGLKNSRIRGMNSTTISGQNITSQIFNSLSENPIVTNLMEDIVDDKIK